MAFKQHAAVSGWAVVMVSLEFGLPVPGFGSGPQRASKPEGTDLVTNGGFEKGTALPAWWHRYPSGTEACQFLY